MSAPLLSVTGLGVEIAGLRICDGLSFQILPGQCWAILGRNGAGKTTLLHTLAGLRPPEHGEILLHRNPLPSLSRREIARHIGLLPQYVEPQFPGTVLEHVLMGRHPHLSRWQWEGPRDLAIARDALAQTGLADLERRQTGTLSGGELQRLAIATLLAQAPGIYLLDEPSNHLDLHHQIILLDGLTQRVRALGQGTMMILHDVNLALRCCDHALLLFGEGECLHGAREDIVSEATLSRLYRHDIRAVAGPRGICYLPA